MAQSTRQTFHEQTGGEMPQHASQQTSRIINPTVSKGRRRSDRRSRVKRVIPEADDGEMPQHVRKE